MTLLAAITSDRTFERENRLLGLVMREAAVTSATEEGKEEIQRLIAEQLKLAGVPVAMQRTADLEAAVGRILERVTSQLPAGGVHDPLHVAFSKLSEEE